MGDDRPPPLTPQEPRLCTSASSSYVSETAWVFFPDWEDDGFGAAEYFSGVFIFE